MSPGTDLGVSIETYLTLKPSLRRRIALVARDDWAMMASESRSDGKDILCLANVQDLNLHRVPPRRGCS